MADGSPSADNRADLRSDSVTAYSFGKSQAGKTPLDEMSQRVKMTNPMRHIGDEKATVASHWHIRHGAFDSDASFPVPTNLATKLPNSGKDVNFFLPWARPHSGDYNFDDLFGWLRSLSRTL